MGQLAPARVEKERCLAMFSGLIPWKNLFGSGTAGDVNFLL